jgi:hypothetical protein
MNAAMTPSFSMMAASSVQHVAQWEVAADHNGNLLRGDMSTFDVRPHNC